ncbi:MAG TPA: hypothetical protein VNI02_07060 [Blastocatellia bacterium]|nr:hypothetical protein [Blastocatellia bacterium]
MRRLILFGTAASSKTRSPTPWSGTNLAVGGLFKAPSRAGEGRDLSASAAPAALTEQRRTPGNSGRKAKGSGRLNGKNVLMSLDSAHRRPSHSRAMV